IQERSPVTLLGYVSNGNTVHIALRADHTHQLVTFTNQQAAKRPTDETVSSGQQYSSHPGLLAWPTPTVTLRDRDTRAEPVRICRGRRRQATNDARFSALPRSDDRWGPGSHSLPAEPCIASRAPSDTRRSPERPLAFPPP